MASRVAQLAVRACPALARSQAAGTLPAASWGVSKASEARQLHASPWQRDQPATESEEQRRALVNRMLYRSRQRGFLELDLLVGMWAEREVPRMELDVVREFEVVLDQENPDMFKWLTGQEDVPPELRGNRAFAALQAHVKAMTDKHHSVPSVPGAEAKEWVRGWSDSGKELAGSGGSAVPPSGTGG